jgi:hypothetical protein
MSPQFGLIMPDVSKVFGKPSKTVVVGHILPSLESIGHDTKEDGDPIFTNERFLPRILVSLGFAKSVSEVKRNRPDLDMKVEPNTSHFIKFGRNLVFIASGFDTKEERDNFEKENIWDDDSNIIGTKTKMNENKKW